MSARIGGRFAPAPLPHVDLPTLTRPQVVDEHGNELTDEQIEAVAEAAVGEAGEHQDGDGVIESEEILVEPSETPGPPLLSLEDSLVLQYSLLQTRQQHTKNLLPLMFSHPPVPGHNKPRLRLPTRTGFVFPTPPPLSQPLPSHEYHGPGHSKDKKAKGAEDDNQAGNEEGDKEQTEKRKPKGKKGDNPGWPAHEIECIARVTLDVGPVSFPNTELWIGTFVAPRAGAAATVRGRPKGLPREKRPYNTGAPKQPLKRPRPDDPERPHQPLTGVASRPPGSAAPPPRPPAVGNYASRSDIPQSLIQRVNAAASQHQWLSILIHKAARNIASKEELTKLGRVVARLGRGEGVGEGPEMPGQPLGPSAAGLMAPVRPVAGPSRPPGTAPGRPPPGPPSQAPPKGSLAPPLPPAAAAGSTSTANQQPAARVQPTVRPPPSVASGSAVKPPAAKVPDSSDSELTEEEEEEVDMTGRPQVGGGPAGAVEPAVPGPKPPIPQPTPSVVRPPAVTATPSVVPTPNAATSVRPPPMAASGVPPRPQPPVGSSLAPPLPGGRPPPNAYYRPPPPGTYRQPGTNTIMVPITAPPKPSHPLPPPFLLIAFKDTPTEKFLLPLGPNSFISRVGDSSVPAPVAPSPATAPASTLVPEVKEEPLPAGKKRTRASLAKPESAPAPDPVPTKEPTPPPAPVKDLYAGLPSVSGMHPKEGTVLLSTFVPHEPWNRPDWTALAKRLPFGNPEFINKLNGTVKQEPEVSPKGKAKAPPSPRSPSRTLRHIEDKPAPREHMVNLAAEPFLPQGQLEPITLRISGLTDDLWRRVKGVVDEVERVELETIAKELNTSVPETSAPAATPSAPAATPSATAAPTTPGTVAPTSAPAPAVQSTPKPPITKAVRDTYLARKKTSFNHLLSRVGQRLFPRFRVETRASTLSDAVADKWAPRPYHLTTRPLYTSTGEVEDGVPVEIDLEAEPDLDISKKKRRPESSVTFEMPVSLDALDERVEAGAARGLARRGRGRGRATPIIRKFRRGTVGATCEGCARVGLKVWRRGPNGRSTLCNGCGDKFLAGTLGDLLAPGAASGANGASGTGTPEKGGDEDEVKGEDGEEKDGEGGDKEAEVEQKETDGEEKKVNGAEKVNGEEKEVNGEKVVIEEKVDTETAGQGGEEVPKDKAESDSAQPGEPAVPVEPVQVAEKPAESQPNDQMDVD